MLDLGVPTGLYGSELTVPYYVFLDAGMEVDVASVRGGVVPVEPLSMKEPLRTADDDRMLGDDELRGKPKDSLPIAGLADFASYDLVYFGEAVGEPPSTSASPELLGKKFRWRTPPGVSCGICHGPLGLLRARRPDGELLVRAAVGSLRSPIVR
ncbi:MAG: hypothetical protein R2862_01200 [Thermoanaerobaculia bacterium]